MNVNNANNANNFGCNIWWTIPELTVDANVAINIIKSYGFDESMIKVPSRNLEVSRAVKSFHNRRSNNGRRIGEKVRSTSNSVVYGILDRQVDFSEEAVNFEQGTKVVLDKDNGTVTVSGVHREAFGQALEDYSGMITDEDLRYFIRKVIRLSKGISKRPTGGIYFIPSDKVGIVERASKCIEEFSTGAKIYIERVMNGSQERSNVWESVQAEVETQIAEVTAAIGRIERRASAVKNQANKIDEIQELVEFYQCLLGEEAKYEGLAEKIEEAVQLVVTKMGEIQSAPQAEPVRRKNTKGSRIMTAAVKVLNDESKPLAYQDIANLAVARGYFENDKGTDVKVSFNIELNRAVRDGDNRIERAGRGQFAKV